MPRVCFLCHQLEQLVDDPVLSEEIPLGESLKLAFAEHMDGLIALDGPLGREERHTPSPRIDAAFDKSMNMFHQIIPHSSRVATRRGLHKPVSSSPPLKTGRAPLRASGFTPLVNLHEDIMKRLCLCLQLHGSPPVDSLCVR
jgi:hypothetical protein